jgi:hypothetical protein
MSSLATNAITDASGGNTATINSYTPTVSNMAGRNRLINSDMRIDQRNAGAAITFNDGVFVVDRFGSACSQSSKATAQRVTTAPTGFNNSVLITSSSAYSVLTGDFFNLFQNIEGFNVADLGWGTATAQDITLSFWVRSSLTGTFGGSISNASLSRSYPFTYTINTANTYEQKTITVPGDTSGSWGVSNDLGMRVYFGLGVGSTYSGTANAWAGTRYHSATGATSVVGTSGATFYITGVQLEAGSVATPFERRQYGQELALCQRYYQKLGLKNAQFLGSGISSSTSQTDCYFKYAITMRSSPTANFNSLVVTDGRNYNAVVSSLGTSYLGLDSARILLITNVVQTIDRMGLVSCSGDTGYIDFSAEL